MAGASGRTSRPGMAMLVGLIATLVVLAAWMLGLADRAELASLDARFQHMSRHQPTGQVMHVDIDDNSLQRVGRWPWPRSTLAGVIETLHECGARLVVLDIVFPEPQEVRFVDETAELYAGPDGPTLGHAAPTAVYDDAIFARTVAETPTIIPMFVTSEASRTPLPPLVNDVLGILRRQPEASFQAVRTSLTQPDQPGRAELVSAYIHARAILAIRRLALPDDAAGTLDIPSGGLVAPVVSLAAATHTTGFVSFKPDLDGVLRHMPMLARADGKIYPQLALSAAADELHASDQRATIRANGRRVTLRADDLLREIPVDSDSRLLINWPDRRVYQRWLMQQHIAAGAVAEVGRMQAAIRRNHALKRLTQLTLAQGRSDTLIELFRQADAIATQRRTAARQHYMAMLYDPANVPPPAAELQQAEQDVERRIDEAFAAFRRDDLEGFYLAAVPDVSENPEARKDYDYLKGLLDYIDRIDRENERKRVFIAAQRKRLRDRVAGKVCFIGSTAAGAADFVPTPLGVRMPGVQVHGWIYETIAAGRYVSPAPAWLNAVVIVACGLLLAAVAATKPVPFTALATVALAVGYAGLNASVIFAYGGVWLVLIAPLGAMGASLLAVTGFRQLTEERAKRRIRDMFSRAMSPVLVDRIMEDPSILKLGGQRRVVTCMFADLANFTPMSEQLGPERTVRLLNRYFDRVTDAVQERGGGYLNKFLGDGVFCFFGAPVMPEDHPARAVRAAIACCRHVRELNAAGETEGVALAIRVGIVSGEAMVGNCGSSDRTDYTAIGDSVNLAARLEAANKYFGTEILVAESTWRASEGEFLARPLGKILVTGQTTPVNVWQVLGEAEQFEAQQRQAVEDFNRGMDAFAERRFTDAITLWRGVLQTWPGDGPTEIFISVAEHCQAAAELDPSGYATQSGKGVERILWPWD